MTGGGQSCCWELLSLNMYFFFLVLEIKPRGALPLTYIPDPFYFLF